MFAKFAALWKQFWPLVIATIFFAALFSLLVCVFSRSIEAYAALPPDFALNTSTGVEDLFMLASGVLGWVGVVLSERTTSLAGGVPLVMTMLCSLVAIGGGFAVAWFLLGTFPNGGIDMLAFSVVASFGAAAFRTYLYDGS
ncbi:MAG: hypothetical protein D6788_08550 [Planctomycetota bacterium]|nr:MAG: hypothetical protein D6788_08550 [Planctomycetota bacterium]